MMQLLRNLQLGIINAKSLLAKPALLIYKKDDRDEPFFAAFSRRGKRGGRPQDTDERELTIAPEYGEEPTYKAINTKNRDFERTKISNELERYKKDLSSQGKKIGHSALKDINKWLENAYRTLLKQEEDVNNAVQSESSVKIRDSILESISKATGQQADTSRLTAENQEMTIIKSLLSQITKMFGDVERKELETYSGKGGTTNLKKRLSLVINEIEQQRTMLSKLKGKIKDNNVEARLEEMPKDFRKIVKKWEKKGMTDEELEREIKAYELKVGEAEKAQQEARIEYDDASIDYDGISASYGYKNKKGDNVKDGEVKRVLASLKLAERSINSIKTDPDLSEEAKAETIEKLGYNFNGLLDQYLLQLEEKHGPYLPLYKELKKVKEEGKIKTVPELMDYLNSLINKSHGSRRKIRQTLGEAEKELAAMEKAKKNQEQEFYAMQFLMEMKKDKNPEAAIKGFEDLEKEMQGYLDELNKGLKKIENGKTVIDAEKRNELILAGEIIDDTSDPEKFKLGKLIQNAQYLMAASKDMFGEMELKSEFDENGDLIPFRDDNFGPREVFNSKEILKKWEQEIPGFKAFKDEMENSDGVRFIVTNQSNFDEFFLHLKGAPAAFMNNTVYLVSNNKRIEDPSSFVSQLIHEYSHFLQNKNKDKFEIILQTLKDSKAEAEWHQFCDKVKKSKLGERFNKFKDEGKAERKILEELIAMLGDGRSKYGKENQELIDDFSSLLKKNRLFKKVSEFHLDPSTAQDIENRRYNYLEASGSPLTQEEHLLHEIQEEEEQQPLVTPPESTPEPACPAPPISIDITPDPQTLMTTAKQLDLGIDRVKNRLKSHGAYAGNWKSYLDSAEEVMPGIKNNLNSLIGDIACSLYPQKQQEDYRTKLNVKFKELAKRLEDMDGKIDEYEDAKKKRGHISAFRTFMENTKFWSLSTLLKSVTEWWEYRKHEHEVAEGERAAAVGAKIFGDSKYGHYLRGKNEDYRAQDINHWKESYKNIDPHELNKTLEKAHDHAQIRALLELKAQELGDFYFGDEQVMRAIERMSNLKVHNAKDAKKAYEAVWGIGEAGKLDRSNISTRRGKMEDYKKEAVENCDRLGEMWEAWVEQKKRGEWVNSARYEGYLRLALEIGKSNTYQVLYYTLKAYKLGILDYQSMVGIGTDLCNLSPQMEYLGILAKAQKSKIEFEGYDGKIYASEIDFVLDTCDPKKGLADPAHYGFSDDFKRWFLQLVNHNVIVRERFSKVGRKAVNLDHDYVQDIFWEWDKRAIENSLKQSTGSVENITPKGVANIYAYFIENAMYWDDAELQDKIDKFKTMDNVLFDNWKRTRSVTDPVTGKTRLEYVRDKNGNFVATPGELAYKEEQLLVTDVAALKKPLGVYRSAIKDALDKSEGQHVSKFREVLQQHYRDIWGAPNFVSPKIRERM